MSDPGKVRGSKLNELFAHLINSRTIISMCLVGTGFERLTCITDVRQGERGDRIVIDMPDGFREAMGQNSDLNLRFNFNGPDQLEYVFCTRGGVLNGRALEVPFPDYAERLQRRRNFRVYTPPGARLVFKTNQVSGIIGVINISLSGIYGTLLKHNLSDMHGPVLKMDQRILKMGIFFPGDDENGEQLVVIRKAEVRRIEHDKDRNLYKYAFEFMDVDKHQHRLLVQQIYQIQRRQLQRR